MRSPALLLGAALAAALWSGCSNQSSPESATPKTVSLGTVELSSGQASRHDLGGGTVCVLTARSLGADSLELIAVLEKSGRRLASTRAGPITADHPFNISFGNTHVELTPHMSGR
jgi:hypothetical protein